MKTKYLFLLAAGYVLLMSLTCNAKAQKQKAAPPSWYRSPPPYAGPNQVIVLGHVDEALIGLYIPGHILPADEALIGKHPEKAAPLLKAEALRHDDHLGVFAEWMQADRSQWAGEAAVMTQRLRKNPDDLNAAFKLSVILYFQWGQRKGTDKNHSEIEKALPLMRKVWTRSHYTLSGLYLIEMSGYPHFDPDLRWKILKDIFAHLLAPEQMTKFREAKRKTWRMEPPNTDSLPYQKQRELYGAVMELWEAHGLLISRAIYKNGKYVGDKDDIPKQQIDDLHNYVNKWYTIIVASLKKEVERK